jgi:hypothetical protein
MRYRSGITPEGKLGLGTSRPDELSHLYAKDPYAKVTVTNAPAASTNYAWKYESNQVSLVLNPRNSETELFAVSSAGAISFPGDLTVGTTPALFVDVSVNRVGIGISDPLAELHIDSQGSSDIILQRTDAIVQQDNPIGRIYFYGGEDGGESPVGSMEVRAVGNWLDTSSPTYMSFHTTNLNEVSATERMRIDHTGHVFIKGNDDTYVGSSDLSLQGSGVMLLFNGTLGGANDGIQYVDTGGSSRYGLIFPGSDVVALGNRAANGVVQIRANTATAGSGGEVTVATFEDTFIRHWVPHYITDGSLSAPSIAFGNDTDLGFYKNATHTIGVAASRLLVQHNSADEDAYIKAKTTFNKGAYLYTDDSHTDGYSAYQVQHDGTTYWAVGFFGATTYLKIRDMQWPADRMQIYPATAANQTLQLAASSLRPATTSALGLGTASYYWKDLYTNRVYLDSSLYLDADAGSTYLRVESANGSTWFGMGNTNWTHFFTDGTSGFYFSTNIAVNGKILGYTDGTAAAPTFSWNNDKDTGLFLSATGVIGFACGGVQELKLSNTYLYPHTASGLGLGTPSYPFSIIYLGDGSAAGPSITFGADSNTGFYRSTTDTIGVSLGGVSEYLINGTYIAPASDNTNSLGWIGKAFGEAYIYRIRFGDGVYSAPSLVFDDDPDTGFYRVTTNTIGISTGGTQRGAWSSSGLEIKQQLIVTGGSRVSVSRNTAQAVSSTAATMVFNVEAEDNLGEWNTSTGTFTAAQSGWYWCYGSVLSALNTWGSNNYFLLNIYQNGALLYRGEYNYDANTASHYKDSHVGGLVYCPAGETITFTIQTNRSGGVNTYPGSNYCHAHIIRIQ